MIFSLISVQCADRFIVVMPGLVPGIHVLLGAKDVDGRDI
jgi:hypothetical protein